MRTVVATRYVTPLHEGGSLPAIVEADDDGMYVLKFRGAGQGPRALIAELIGGELARVLGLPVPELVFMWLDADLARTEHDQEIQDLAVVAQLLPRQHHLIRAFLVELAQPIAALVGAAFAGAAFVSAAFVGASLVRIHHRSTP